MIIVKTLTGTAAGQCHGSHAPPAPAYRQRFSAALLLAASASAGADHTDHQGLSEAAWTADIPKVVFATRQEQSVTNAPSSVTVINREMIAAQGALNVAEVLRLVPGFQVFASNGSTFGVTPHGFSDRDPKRMEVRVNGRSVYLPQLSSVAWESLGIVPDDIDHIEVVRGSNVPAYGSNAILGAINIVTRNPVQEGGGSVKLGAGSAGTKVNSARQNFSTDTMAMQVRAAYKESDGFGGVDDEAHVSHLVFNNVYTPDLSTSIETEFGYSKGTFGVGDGDHLDEFSDEQRRAAWFNANWQYSLHRQRFNLRVSYSDYDFQRSRKQLLSGLLSDALGAAVPPELIPQLGMQPGFEVLQGHVDEALELEGGDRDFSVFNLELEHHLDLSNGSHVVWGLGTRMDRIHDGTFVEGGVDTAVNYLFANLEWELIPPLVLNAGFMLEDNNGFDPELSPRLALNYHINPNHHLRASVTRAYRQPALLESDRLWTLRFADGDLIDLVQISDPDIRSERVDTFEVGYYYFAFEGRLGLDIKLLREQMRYGIDRVDAYADVCADPNPDPLVAPLVEAYCPDFFVNGEDGAPLDPKVGVFSNTARWDLEGMEAQLTWKIDARSWLRLDYAYFEMDSERAWRMNKPNYVSLDPDSVPRKSGGLLYSIKLPQNWRFGSYLRYEDEVKWRSGTDVDSHTRLDMTVAKTWRWGASEAELNLTVQNAAKDTYLEFQNNNEFGRRAFVSLTVQWP